jgi:hypothetical protein
MGSTIRSSRSTQDALLPWQPKGLGPWCEPKKKGKLKKRKIAFDEFMRSAIYYGIS